MSKTKKKPTRAEQKRNEREDKRKKSVVNSDGTHTTWERVFWIVGLLTVLFSLYVLVASISYLSTWREDFAVLDTSLSVANACGRAGAVLAHLIISKAFGLFGLLVPIVCVLLGCSMFLGRSRVLWRSMLSIMLITICGSLTMAALPFGKDLFNSGLGGECGMAVTGLLEGKFGSFGVWLILVAAWILTLVVININVIDFLRRTTTSGVERGIGMFASLKDRIARKNEEDEYEEDEYEDEEYEDDAVEAEDKVRVVTTPPVVPPATPVATPTTPPTTPPAAEPVQTPVVPVAPVVNQVETPQVQPTETAATENKVEEQPVAVEQQVDEAKSKSNIDVVEVYEHTDERLSAAEVDKHRQFNPDSTPDYVFPKIDCLKNHENGAEVSNDEIEQNKQRIEETLGNFGVPIVSMTATIGPTVTLYEIVQVPGVKVSRVQMLDKDIAQSLKARGIRIIAPIPGKGTIGIEVPNINKETVSMRSAIQSERFQNFKAELPVVIGRTIQNENFVFDLAKMPHLLVAGATGQGKSVGLNAIIASLLYRKDPSQLKFVLIDPKTVEFSLYDKLEKHFLAKMESEEDIIVKDPKKALYTLNSLCVEMENRLRKCGDVGVRNIVEYNEMVRKHNIEDDIMPYIVVIIDEFADLIMSAKEVEKPVMRLAQKARAIGIHLIVATQRPDVKVITGTIKANFPARIAFRVMQMIDSRTIIDQPGAQQLIGRGDMLMSVNGELTRIQCAFVDTPEVRDIVEHISEQPFPYPSGTYLLPDYEDNSGSASGGSEGHFGSESGAPQHFDEHFAAVARDAVASGKLSTSSIQSVYGVGFNRAGRITRQLEQAGIVGPANGSKPRDAKIFDMAELEALLQQLGVE